MRIISATAPKALRLAGRGPELSSRARLRLKWMDYYSSHDQDARLTCRYFGISPQTFYRWKRRYNLQRLESLEERSRRPHRVRQPTASPALVEAVLRLREKYPRWGKDKLVLLLQQEGFLVSTSMVGRILRRLKERGVLVEPLRRPGRVPPGHGPGRRQLPRHPLGTDALPGESDPGGRRLRV